MFYTAVLKLEVKVLTEYRCPGELILCDILYALSQVLLQLCFARKTHMLCCSQQLDSNDTVRHSGAAATAALCQHRFGLALAMLAV